jgi:hypothetical protein
MRHLLVVTIIVAALAGAVVQLNRNGQSERVAATASSDAPASELRLVIVGSKAKLGDNDGTLRVGYERGPRAPAREQFAEVVTDENCEPDAEGVSHCSNNIKLKNGKILRVQHAHRMHEVPCLVPGEKVRLRAA